VGQLLIRVLGDSFTTASLQYHSNLMTNIYFPMIISTTFYRRQLESNMSKELQLSEPFARNPPRRARPSPDSQHPDAGDRHRHLPHCGAGMTLRTGEVGEAVLTTLAERVFAPDRFMIVILFHVTGADAGT
jgi:hypothetical protein